MELTVAPIKNPYTHYAVAAVYKKWAPLLEHTGKVVIAGGAARDVCAYNIAPKDFDIFILNPKEDFLTYNFYKFVKDVEKCESVPVFGSGHHAAMSFSWQGKIVQIMKSSCNTPEELLDEFDWNCCNYVFDGKEYYQGDDTKVFAEYRHLQLNENWNKSSKSPNPPLAALRRGFIFAYKYNCAMSVTDEKMLIERMASDSDAKIINRMRKLKAVEEGKKIYTTYNPAAEVVYEGKPFKVKIPIANYNSATNKVTLG